ncbi:hypothetical protein DPQ25_07950 [Hydrogeniiclostridium mannosilyticum]|uniref:N-acetyltransferase domain-containing protein n=1 Tax=Hydrogeniiclostridium mannosilyticum TaxID=2764322 RepID=A0A328UBG6_9FIRM|nr:GNAT family N-acetyltransferase [Hydrogeniiclostridium mannosilyticum]RAQ28717.1 hypothetical protein DPQ25_07950 [Hydrogeniiclostridium mannosilyticum]
MDTIDTFDNRLKYYHFLLCRDNLDNLPDYPLPAGYRFVFYRDGDKKDWIEIEKSAGEFIDEAGGLAAWQHYYGGREHLLGERMLFITGPDGRKIATATAFFDDSDSAGWLHWVSVRRDCQGAGLSRPLIAKALRVLRGLGYRDAKIPTQTTSWVAVKLYLDFGFRPEAENALKSREGYRIVRTLTNHPALRDFPPLPREALWDPLMRRVHAALLSRCPDLEAFCLQEKDGLRLVRYRTGSGCFSTPCGELLGNEQGF